MEIKIWNENVNSCFDCKYAIVAKYDGAFCCLNNKSIMYYYFNDKSIIDSDCPFLVVPTKELIEGLGFRFIEYDKSSKYSIYKKKMNYDFNFEYTLGISDSFVIYIAHENFFFINNFHIDNFEHLKFILSGFRII